jgi:CRP-like cAMP-binding protein
MKQHSNACATSNCKACGIRESALFGRLEEGDLTLVHDAVQQCLHEPEDLLYRLGDPAGAVYTIRSGWVKLVRYLPDGSYRIVRIASAGDVLGLEGVLSQPYLHDAIVLQPSQICRIPVEVLKELSENTPELHRALMERWHRALTEADDWLTELSTGAARHRVMRLLLRLADESGQGRGPLLSRKDMGAVLGVTTESASRAVAELKRAGLLQEGGGRFSCARDALEKKIGTD